MDDADLDSWLTLLRAPGIGPAAIAALLDRFGSVRNACAAGAAGWRAAGLSRAQVDGLSTTDAAGLAADRAWLAGASDRCLLTLDDPRYPQRLREIAQPPAALFCQGDPRCLAEPQLAIVGARTATPQGLENAHAFAAELARRGLAITSGLALGIDGAAHRGALEGGGPTIAVCGTGLDRVYPARHRALAHEIAGRGVLVSEFSTGVGANAENFPRRNRIISGLALGVLVVEAAPESGSLITARLAMEQGREVFAIPGSIHNPLAHGCHQLIRQGAKLVESVNDILEEIAPQLAAALRSIAAPAPAALDPVEERLLAALGYDPAPLDTLVDRCGLAVEQVQAALLNLELKGAVASVPGGAFQRVSPGIP